MAEKVIVSIARRLYPKPSAAAVSRSPDLLQCQIAYNRYGGYCVPESSSSRPACKAILAGDIWEPQTIQLMREECGKGDIVHAGTFFGDFLPALSPAAAPGAKIWAFEPSFENYRCARITCEINCLANVELAHAALGALRASARIKTTDTTDRALGGSAMICADGTEQVNVVTIDEVTAGRDVSIVQLDVEGYEREALEGAVALIRRCRPLLIVEALKGSTLLEGDWFGASILSLGYRITDRFHGNAVLRC